MTDKTLTSNDFGYEYFDDPEGTGYQGYQKDFDGDRGDKNHVPRQMVLQFCQEHDVKSANDWGCAKGYLVEELLNAGIDAVGYDISDYAVSFIQGLPCSVADIRVGGGRSAEVTIVLGVLQYISEDDLPRALANIRRTTTRYFLFEMYYEGAYQKVPDALRVITRPQSWWRQKIEEAGFRYDSQTAEFEVYTVE